MKWSTCIFTAAMELSLRTSAVTKPCFSKNVYGVRIDKHYGCGANLSTEPQFMMLLRSIKGLNIDSLNKNEKEIAAKAIESGLLTKDRQMLETGGCSA